MYVATPLLRVSLPSINQDAMEIVSPEEPSQKWEGLQFPQLFVRRKACSCAVDDSGRFRADHNTCQDR